ncbi:flagellar motor protein MotB [uncultured Sphingomonas sp.]|uniref:flagellar motor protein MotB n=1 Tax=uncultured Sphingomonas sp. TaxID=158754 RepID=UPI0025CE1B5F|nr:flagellar motor protein MotB [uncultured Sphingomonas sp.]
MTEFDFPAPAPARPIWLVTLADLALLLVGFLVLVQAMGAERRPALVNALRAEFGTMSPAAQALRPAAPVMPVAAAALRFAPGSAEPVDPDPNLVPWAREALADPRVRLSVVAATDGSAADVDPVTHSAVVLAADRARAAAALIGPVAANRLTLSTATTPGQRTALVTLVFAGEPRRKSQ